MLAKLRAALGDLPACKALIKRFQGDAALCWTVKRFSKPRVSRPHLAQCKPLIDAMPTAALRLELTAYLEYELESAATLGLEQVGLPISSDAIESLFGVAKRHGVGETQDADRIALAYLRFVGCRLAKKQNKS